MTKTFLFLIGFKKFKNHLVWFTLPCTMSYCYIDLTNLKFLVTYLKPGSGRPKSARTRQNIQRVIELICSQDDPHSHKTPWKIERETDISRTTVRRIVKQDLQLKTHKCVMGR